VPVPVPVPVPVGRGQGGGAPEGPTPRCVHPPRESAAPLATIPLSFFCGGKETSRKRGGERIPAGRRARLGDTERWTRGGGMASSSRGVRRTRANRLVAWHGGSGGEEERLLGRCAAGCRFWSGAEGCDDAQRPGAGRGAWPSSWITWACHDQGSPNRREQVRFDQLPVKPVWPGIDLGRYQTGGNRSGLGRYQTGSNSKFKFEFKK
jgi:hypothetical protein